MHRLIVISDWKGDCLYRSLFEGLVTSMYPDVTISFIDTVRLFSIFEAALILRYSVLQYPENTFFIVGVSSVVPKTNGYLYIKLNNKHIFAPNNGIISLLDDYSDKMIIRKINYEKSTFPEIELFIPFIEKILNNENLDEFSKIENSFIKFTPLLPSFSNNIITASVIYIDYLGNAITNVTKDYFQKKVGKNQFTIYPGTKLINVEKISLSYDEVNEMQPFALFNSIGLLEIGTKNASLCEHYNLKFLSNITIKVYDNASCKNES
jgi:S-adenosylmethionine hydrolase